MVAAIVYAVYRASNRKPLEGRLFGLTFILAYGFRAFIEIYKENQVPFENTLPLNMGQLLSLPFILLGFFFFFGLHRNFALFRRGLSSEGLEAYGDDDYESAPKIVRNSVNIISKLCSESPFGGKDFFVGIRYHLQ